MFTPTSALRITAMFSGLAVSWPTSLAAGRLGRARDDVHHLAHQVRLHLTPLLASTPVACASCSMVKLL